MGRHGRSAVPPVPEETGSAGRHRAGARAKKRFGTPVRTGLLGASAAVAVGAVAVASGLLPGGGGNPFGTSDTSATGGGQVRTEVAPQLPQQRAAGTDETGRPSVSPSRSSARPQGPSASPSPTPAKPSATPSKESKAPAAPPKAKRSETPSSQPPAPAPAPTRTENHTVEAPSAPVSAENAVLALVNQERAKVGCAALTADASLGALAQDFSDDMAARDFFDHTDPDGRTPWDRADAAGVSNLGGENIARGQADAQAVMDAWMNSEGHRANILNCDYTRIGVGVHTGPGGPWWTQDFGF
ncbi:CAP domain-containing protein [Streptomyces sp. NPDC088725]|uniref:CAP domain-containing protein n=1 Tax=Streptomyces sp. NPDC088725 TaxID=3365873 RepID=UPI0037F4FE11